MYKNILIMILYTYKYSVFSFKCWNFNGLSDIQQFSAGSLSDLIAY